jgi:hypothetical protein
MMLVFCVTKYFVQNTIYFVEKYFTESFLKILTMVPKVRGMLMGLLNRINYVKVCDATNDDKNCQSW